ncbi:MAG: glycosyltransferase, partial [Candidatus Latescibacterota bacterium]
SALWGGETGMKLTVLSVAYPFAPVRSDTAGGAEQVLLSLDRALVKAGYRSIVAACQGSRPSGILVEIPPVRDIIDDSVRQKIHELLRNIILRTLRGRDIDIVHMHGIDFPAYLPPPGAPVLATLHLPPAWYDLSGLQTGRPGTYFNCVSRSQESSCPRLPGLLPFIENGVDIKAFEKPSPRGKYAVALGRICPEKGCHIALEAARTAQIPLIIAGEVFPYESHRRYYSERILPFLDGREYRFLGRVGFERKRRLLAGAGCLLVPSLVPETSSLVAMEALASGTPVIAFPAGALADIVEDGKTGFLVQNAREMAEAMGKTRHIHPETCRASARERFPAERMTEKYLEIYRRIARGNSIENIGEWSNE